MRPFRSPGSQLHFFFFLSGIAGLIYEVVWTRWLTGVLGSASAATAIVLAVFMGGLGIGSWLSARWADRIARPVRLFAALQLGVVALVLLPLLEMGWAAVFLSYVSRWSGPVSPLLDVCRFAVAAIAIGPPTVLMGAGLPLLVNELTPSPQCLGHRTASLYAINTLGGVFGTLLAGFWLIEMLGLRSTSMIAGGLGTVAGVLALRLDRRSDLAPVSVASSQSDRKNESHASARRKRGRRVPPGDDRATSPLPQTKMPPFQPPSASRAAALWVMAAGAIAGSCALGYEIVWFRVLSTLTLNTTYAFSLMLALLLCGLGIGSWLIRTKLDHLEHVAEWLVGIQMLLAMYGLLSLLWAPNIAVVAEWLVPIGHQGLLKPWFARPLVMGLCLLLVPTVLMGASLPVACKLYGSLTGGIGRPVGRIYAANTFGSVFGSLAVGLLVIPFWGTWWAALVCALAGMASAAGVASTCVETARRPAFVTAVAGAACVLLGIGVLMGGSVFGREGLGPAEEVRFRCEDQFGLVEVVENRNLGTRWMYTNRLHWEGSTLPRAVADQRKQGLLPLVLHQSPRRVLEIGLGTGIKLSALRLPVVEEAVAVEISTAVVEASRFFDGYNHRRIDGSSPTKSKIRTVCADGRNYVSLVPGQFDVIVNGLLTPYRAGVGRLYTLEHFRACRAKLAPGGMFVVWVAVRQIDPEDLKVLIRTLMEVFPHTTLWLDGYYSALVCETRPLVWDEGKIEARLGFPGFREVLDEAGLDSPLDLMASFVAGPQTLSHFVDGQPLNTEDRPIIEFRTPRQGDRLNTEALAATILELLIPLQEPLCPVRLAANANTEARLRHAQQARGMAWYALVQKSRGRHLEAVQLFQRALEENPHDDLARYELEIYLVAYGKECLKRELLDQARHAFEQAVQANPRSVGALASLAMLEEAAGHGAESEKLRRHALSLDPHNVRLRERLAISPNDKSLRRF